jgi:hypothetical protein
MRLITDSELAIRTDLELAILFHMASQAPGGYRARIGCPAERHRQPSEHRPRSRGPSSAVPGTGVLIPGLRGRLWLGRTPAALVALPSRSFGTGEGVGREAAGIPAAIGGAMVASGGEVSVHGPAVAVSHGDRVALAVARRKI